MAASVADRPDHKIVPRAPTLCSQRPHKATQSFQRKKEAEGNGTAETQRAVANLPSFHS